MRFSEGKNTVNLNLNPEIPNIKLNNIQQQTMKTLVDDDSIISKLRKANVTIKLGNEE